MNELKYILEKMKDIGKNASSITNSNDTHISVLTSLLSKKDEMPEGTFDLLDSHLKKARSGKVELEKELAEIEKTLKRNGNNNSK